MSFRNTCCLATTVLLLITCSTGEIARASTVRSTPPKDPSVQYGPPWRLTEEPPVSEYGHKYPLAPRIEKAHHSQTFGIYLDGGQAEHIMFHYRGCPITPRGALRLTIFLANPTNGRPTKRYSETIVDHRSSDTRWYYIPVDGGVIYTGVVEIPSKRGCSVWTLWATTN